VVGVEGEGEGEGESKSARGAQKTPRDEHGEWLRTRRVRAALAKRGPKSACERGCVSTVDSLLTLGALALFTDLSGSPQPKRLPTATGGGRIGGVGGRGGDEESESERDSDSEGSWPSESDSASSVVCDGDLALQLFLDQYDDDGGGGGGGEKEDEEEEEEEEGVGGGAVGSGGAKKSGGGLGRAVAAIKAAWGAGSKGGRLLKQDFPDAAPSKLAADDATYKLGLEVALCSLNNELEAVCEMDAEAFEGGEGEKLFEVARIRRAMAARRAELDKCSIVTDKI